MFNNYIAIMAAGFLFSGCMNTQSVKLFIAEHNQDAYNFRVRPYDANLNTVKHKPDYPEDFCYVDCLMIVQNMTEYPLYLSEEWGSGGYKNVALDIRKKDGKAFTLKKHEGTWGRNFPSMLIVPPHSMLAYPLSLDAGIWDGLPQIEIGEEIWIRARLWMGYTKINGKMVRLAQKNIESRWTAVTIKARRLAHISEVNQCN